MDMRQVLAGFKNLLAVGLTLVLVNACSEDPTLTSTGLLEWDRLELVAEGNEPVLRLLVQEGDRLEAGAIILQQDARRVQAQLDEALALGLQAQAKLAELSRGPRGELIAEAKARLQGLQSEEDSTRREWLRSQSLVAKKLISPEAVDLARTQLQKASANKNAARAALEAMLNGATVEELNQAEAAVAQADAHARALQVTLDNMTLRAPRAGLLDSLLYDVGERPPPGAVIAVLLVDTAPYARVYVPEPVRAQVQQGSSATIYVDGIAQSFEGRVRSISSDAVFTPYYSLTENDRSRLSFLARVEFVDSEGQNLPSGLPLRVEFKPVNASGE